MVTAHTLRTCTYPATTLTYLTEETEEITTELCFSGNAWIAFKTFNLLLFLLYMAVWS